MSYPIIIEYKGNSMFSVKQFQLDSNNIAIYPDEGVLFHEDHIGKEIFKFVVFERYTVSIHSTKEIFSCLEVRPDTNWLYYRVTAYMDQQLFNNALYFLGLDCDDDQSTIPIHLFEMFLKLITENDFSPESPLDDSDIKHEIEWAEIVLKLVEEGEI